MLHLPIRISVQRRGQRPPQPLRPSSLRNRELHHHHALPRTKVPRLFRQQCVDSTPKEALRRNPSYRVPSMEASILLKDLDRASPNGQIILENGCLQRQVSFLSACSAERNLHGAEPGRPKTFRAQEPMHRNLPRHAVEMIETLAGSTQRVYFGGRAEEKPHVKLVSKMLHEAFLASHVAHKEASPVIKSRCRANNEHRTDTELMFGAGLQETDTHTSEGTCGTCNGLARSDDQPCFTCRCRSRGRVTYKGNAGNVVILDYKATPPESRNIKETYKKFYPVRPCRTTIRRKKAGVLYGR